MSKLTYISSKGKKIELDGDFIFSGAALGIRGHMWQYEEGHKNLKSISRGARKEQIEIGSVSFEHVDEMVRAFNADMCSETPGKFVVSGKWFQRAFVVGMTPTDRGYDWMRATLDVMLLDGVWRCEHKKAFNPAVKIAKKTPYLDRPYDYAYDYAETDSDTSIKVESPSCDLKIIIYGPATNPYISIADNRYELMATIDSGTYVEISTIDHTIIQTTINATRDLFALGIRYKGAGSGNYIFQRLPAGLHNVAWNKSFGFDVVWYEEEGAPPWSIH